MALLSFILKPLTAAGISAEAVFREDKDSSFELREDFSEALVNEEEGGVRSSTSISGVSTSSHLSGEQTSGSSSGVSANMSIGDDMIVCMWVDLKEL